ncbi:uncharacterized protein LOC111619994, partial [Centruroides sculpturatus]|uniref:uncharacterized protein LOC111619994 n=1 Tax=Centruroides sculpturatus TaxID=218467 RepID=UPI000C6D0E06
ILILYYENNKIFNSVYHISLVNEPGYFKNGICRHKSLYAIDLVSRIPEADIYLMEQKRLRAKHLTHVPYMIRQTALESFILSQFKHSEDILPTHLKVVTIKSSSLSSVFQIQVGNERVTSQDIIHKLLNKETVPFLPSLPKMSFGPALRELYFRSNLTDREFMCNSLLLCLAFYEHIVFKAENNIL